MDSGTILVVEDSADLRKLYSIALRAHGFTTIDAESGSAALRLSEGRIVDAIVLDLTLPDMEGEEVIEAIRQRAGNGEIDFIVLSGQGDAQLRAARMGARAGFLKPVSPLRLAEAVRSACRSNPLRTPGGPAPLPR